MNDNQALMTCEVEDIKKAHGVSPIELMEKIGLFEVPGHPGGTGYHPFPDHPHGLRRRRHQGSHRKGGGPGLRRVRPCGDGHCSRHHGGLAAAGAERGLCVGPGNFRAGDQLPLRAGSGNAGGHHGGQRSGREKRDPV